jgi:hypothetical protein
VRPYLKKIFTKKGLVEWLMVKALSSSPSTAKKKTIKIHTITEGRSLCKYAARSRAICKPRREISGETKPANTLTVDF